MLDYKEAWDKCQKDQFNFLCQGVGISLPNARKHNFFSNLIIELLAERALYLTGNYWPWLPIFFQHLEHKDFAVCSRKMLLQTKNCSPLFYLLAICHGCWYFFSTLSIEILFSVLGRYSFRVRNYSLDLELNFFCHFSFSSFEFVFLNLHAERERAFYLLAILGHGCWYFFSTLSIEILFSVLGRCFFRARTCSPDLELNFFCHFVFSSFDFFSSNVPNVFKFKSPKCFQILWMLDYK